MQSVLNSYVVVQSHVYTHTQFGPPMDSSLPPYTPSPSLTTGKVGGSGGGAMTQGDRLCLIKRERPHTKSASTGGIRYVYICRDMRCALNGPLLPSYQLLKEMV